MPRGEQTLCCMCNLQVKTVRFEKLRVADFAREIEAFGRLQTSDDLAAPTTK